MSEVANIITEEQKGMNEMEQPKTVRGNVEAAISDLMNIPYANAEEVSKFAPPILNAINLLRECITAWDAEEKANQERPAPRICEEEQDVEIVETGIDGGIADGQETNT